MMQETQYLYLTTKGWKTGRLHEIEIWFVVYQERYYLVAEHREKAHWVKNIMNNPQVRLRVETQSYPGTGRIVDPAAEPDLAHAVSALMEAKYKWSDGLIVELMPDK